MHCYQLQMGFGDSAMMDIRECGETDVWDEIHNLLVGVGTIGQLIHHVLLHGINARNTGERLLPNSFNIGLKRVSRTLILLWRLQFIGFCLEFF